MQSQQLDPYADKYWCKYNDRAKALQVITKRVKLRPLPKNALKQLKKIVRDLSAALVHCMTVSLW